jgi:NDP-sugar pyrophosphorylase family protein
MHVIITMAGLGQRFKDSGETVAKPFVSVGDQSALKHLTDILPDEWKIYFAVGDHLRSAQTESEIQKLNKKNYKIKYVPYSPRGPVDTVLAVLPELNPGEPVIVSYCDYTMIWNAEEFINQIQNSNSDAAIVSYKGFHPTYLGPNSYCHLQVDNNGFVTDLQEKKLFTDDLQSEWTSCGMYYFKSADFLKHCLHEQLKQDLCYRISSLSERAEYYTSLALKAMKNKNHEIKILNYQIEYFIQFGTPFDIQLYEYWKSYFSSLK